MSDLPEGYLYDYDADPARPAPEPQPADERPDREQPAAQSDTLHAIIARYRQDYDQRTYDYSLRGEPAKLARGSQEHAAAFASRQPQWHNHVARCRGQVRVTYYQAILSEVGTLGPDVDALL